MEPIVLFVLFSMLLIAVSVIGAYLPQIGAMKDGTSHLMIALSAGIFLGLLLFMLLPEGLEESDTGGLSILDSMVVLVIGFVAILSLDVFMKNRHMNTCGCHDEDHGHNMASMSSFIGLAIHAACDGLALAAMFMAGEEVGLMATVGLCIHKFAELFSLSTTTLVTNIGRRQSMIRLGLFSLITPLAGLIFFLLFSDMEVEGTLGIPLMFAAGTLLYVTTCDMIPEAFHREDGIIKSLVMMLIGMALMLGVAVFFPE